ncbi:Ig-like domain-containing protein [Dokdonella sp.]|uniref:Ig-like domain-containing protein n=1 Tax=Dokdonella sp. TaxID=2291710 RepID=UPI00352744CD
MRTNPSLAPPGASSFCFMNRVASASIRLTVALLLLVSGAMAISTTHAAAVAGPSAAISVANGDFSNTANDGSIGGLGGGGSGTGVLGTGPWGATYTGIAGVGLPPLLTIGSGNASVSGLLGLDIVTILNNGGRFHQNTGVSWEPGRRYTLSVDVDAGSTLAASVLTSGNIGIALATDNSIASRLVSTTAGTGVLTLLGGTSYRLELEYETGPTVSGNIHVQLFAEPSGLLTANLLGSATFDNVGLTTQLLTQVPSTIQPANPGPYSATVGLVVNPAIDITVRDALGDPIQGVSVSFAAPSTGASATVVPNPALTDINGVAQVVTTANTVAGAYQISATVAGVATPLQIDLTNLADVPASTGPINGGGQSAGPGAGFVNPIGLQVLDQFGNPVGGVEVTFIPPASGASSSFSPNPAITDANGMVSVTATANTIAGTYDVEVSIAGITPNATFELTNLPGPAAAIGSLSGSGQGAVTNTAFANPLGVQVQDAFGNAVPGVAVSFVAPGAGPSVVLSPMMATSGSDGFVSTNATANAIAGEYSVSISVAGLGTLGSFNLTNLLDPSIGPGPVSEPNQNAAIGTVFACVLMIEVTDGSGAPLQGLIVDFVAPTSGPSATLMRGAASGTSLQIASDADGLAWVEAVANGIEGVYTVGAQLRYSLAAPVEFTLRNLAANDPVYSNGFDGGCVPAVGAVEDVTSTE